MKELLESLKMKFDGDPLAAAVTGLYLNGAPQDTAYPFIVFLLVTDTPYDTFNTRTEEARIQFSIFSDSSSTEEVCDIFNLLTVCFDYCELTVDDYDFVEMRRTNSNLIREEENVWHYVVGYKVILQKA